MVCFVLSSRCPANTKLLRFVDLLIYFIAYMIINYALLCARTHIASPGYMMDTHRKERTQQVRTQ